MRTSPCDILAMKAGQAWDNMAEALRLANTAPRGYWRNYWLQIARHSELVWEADIENKLTLHELKLKHAHNPLDHTAKGKGR